MLIEQIAFMGIILGALLGVSGLFIGSINDMLGYRLFATGSAILIAGFLTIFGGFLFMSF